VEKKRKNSRKEKAIETKKKIYEAANDLFRKYGYENISVDSIVEAAGVSKGAFYVHYTSKDALVAAVINDYVNEVDLDYKSFFESLDAKETASEMLISLIAKIADILNTIGCNHLKSLYKAQITKTVDTNSVLSYTREIYKMFSYILNKGMQQGEFRSELPVDTLTKHCFIAYRGLIYEWCIRYPDFDLKEQALKHFEILLTGLKKQ
jgi:AcrR family transcriptional regulator